MRTKRLRGPARWHNRTERQLRRAPSPLTPGLKRSGRVWFLYARKPHMVICGRRGKDKVETHQKQPKRTRWGERGRKETRTRTSLIYMAAGSSAAAQRALRESGRAAPVDSTLPLLLRSARAGARSVWCTLRQHSSCGRRCRNAESGKRASGRAQSSARTRCPPSPPGQAQAGRCAPSWR